MSSRKLARVLGLMCGLALLGCQSADPAVGSGESEIGEEPAAAGIVEGGLDEEGVLLLANDRDAIAEVLVERTKLAPALADRIAAFRKSEDGAPRWFLNLDDLDALPGTDKGAFEALVTDARASGYTEAPGFDPPTLAKIAVPDGLGRPPTAEDVTVEAGFDGKPAEEAFALVRARLTNTVHRDNERFVSETIRDRHKAFTIAVGNIFAKDSPHAAFAQSLGAEKLMLIGTMSALNPTILVAEKAGVVATYARGESGRYEPIDAPKYPVIMRAKLRLATGAEGDPGQGVRVFYPAWSAKVLVEPTTVIIEGG